MMAAPKLTPLVISTLCLLSLIGAAYSHEKLEVGGYVYCDTCRALFETSASVPLPGAKVKLECRDRDNANNVTLTVQATCNEKGEYNFEVEGKREDEICEVILEQSGRKDCDETLPGLDRARVLVTDNSGMTSNTRFVNALGFIKKKADPGCAEVLKSYGLLPDSHI